MAPSDDAAPARPAPGAIAAWHATLVAAAAARRRVRLVWRDPAGPPDEALPGSDPIVVGTGCSGRPLRPLGCLDWEGRHVLAAWCEQGQAFVSVPLEHIVALEALDETFPDEPGRGLADHRRALQTGMDERDRSTDA